MEKRGGRPMKHYRVTRPQFFVPFRLSSALTLEELLYQSVEEANRLIARSIAKILATHSGQVGYLIYQLPSGRVAHDLSLGGREALDSLEGSDPWWRDGQVLQLSAQRARELMQELAALFQRYAKDQGGDYLAFAAIAPINR